MTAPIRPAVPADLAAIVAFDHVGEADPRRPRFISDSIGRGECVVWDDGAIAGYGILNERFFGAGFVALLVVHPDRRREGIGTALLRAMDAACDNPKLFTSTNRSNAPMQTLLAKAGWTPSGVVENLDPGDPELIYFLEQARRAHRIAG